jgi:transposase-like protein
LEGVSAGPESARAALSDDHPGLKRAIVDIVREAAWHRRYVPFPPNALDYLPRKGDDTIPADHPGSRSQFAEPNCQIAAHCQIAVLDS